MCKDSDADSCADTNTVSCQCFANVCYYFLAVDLSKTAGKAVNVFIFISTIKITNYSMSSLLIGLTTTTG